MYNMIGMDTKYKAVTFVTSGEFAKGHYFYDVTLPQALLKMKEKGIDPIDMKNIKMNIACYPY